MPVPATESARDGQPGHRRPETVTAISHAPGSPAADGLPLGTPPGEPGQDRLRSSGDRGIPMLIAGRRIGGIGLGTAALLGGLLASGPWHYLALLDIPAFGLAALVALKHVEDVQWSEFAVRKGERLAEREKKIRDQFDFETQPIRSAMKAVGVEKPARGALEPRPPAGRAAHRGQGSA